MRISGLLLLLSIFYMFSCGDDMGSDDPMDPMEDPMDDPMEVDTTPPPPVGISGTLWIDANYDGILDESEEKFEGATINFYNADNGNKIGAVPTSNTGKFFLNPSVVINYYLEVEMPNSGYVSSAYGNDNSLTEENGKLTCNTYSTADGIVLNFGVHRSAALGNSIWIDSGSAANVQDAGDEPYKGATINLYKVENSVETLADTKTSDNNGNYLFKDLRVGDYIIEYQIDDAEITGFVMPDQGADDEIDSDVVTTMTPSPNLVGRSDVFSITESGVNLSYDAGIIK